MRRNAKLQPLVPFHGSNVQSKRCPCTYPCWSFKKLRVIKTMQFKDIEISWNSICKMKRTFTERTRSSPCFGGSKIPKKRFMQTPPEIRLIELLVTTILSPKCNKSIYLPILSQYETYPLDTWPNKQKSLFHKNVLVQLPWCGCCKKYITQLVLNLPEPTTRPTQTYLFRHDFLGYLWYLCETKYREQFYANSPGCWMRCPFLEGFPSNQIINLWSLQLASGVFLFVCFVFGKEVYFSRNL